MTYSAMMLPPPYIVPRKEPRYDLRLPVSVSLSSGLPVDITAVSENVSLHGILMWTAAAIPEGTYLKLVLVVGSRSRPRNTYLTAVGKVLRVEPRDSGSFGVAVYCDKSPFQVTRPFDLSS